MADQYFVDIRNGVVDAADETRWRETDYCAWKSRFGKTAGVGTNAAVREPATLELPMFATPNWFLRRGREKFHQLVNPWNTPITHRF